MNQYPESPQLLLIGLGFLTYIIIFILIIVFIVKILSHKAAPDQPRDDITRESVTKYKYFLRNHIMTTYEEKFFMTLCEIFNDKCYIIPQVHLSQLLDHRVKNQNWQGALSHIDRKSVDFVLLKRSDLTVLCAIELDDQSHNLDKRKERDHEVERLFNSVHLPLVRFKNVDTMAKQEIVDRIALTIKDV